MPSSRSDPANVPEAVSPRTKNAGIASRRREASMGHSCLLVWGVDEAKRPVPKGPAAPEPRRVRGSVVVAVPTRSAVEPGLLGRRNAVPVARHADRRGGGGGEDDCGHGGGYDLAVHGRS